MVLNMPKEYDEEFKKKIVHLHVQEGKTLMSLCDEYGIAKSTINGWCQKYSEECQKKAQEDPNAINEYTFIIVQS